MLENVIAIRLQQIAQLFNSFDPSPFLEKDLDKDAVEHIVAWAQETDPGAALTIRLHLPVDEAKTIEAQQLSSSLKNYFNYRTRQCELEKRELFRRGRRALAVGLPVLAICLVGSQVLRSALATNPLSRVLEESLIIFGWVANWTPIELLLYDWWPIVRRRDLYQRLAEAKIDIVEYAHPR